MPWRYLGHSDNLVSTLTLTQGDPPLKNPGYAPAGISLAFLLRTFPFVNHQEPRKDFLYCTSRFEDDINMSAIHPLAIQNDRSNVMCIPLFISFAARVFQSRTFFCEDSGDDDRGIRFWWYFQFRCHCSRGHVVSVHCVPHRHDTPLDELAGNNSNHRAVFKWFSNNQC